MPLLNLAIATTGLTSLSGHANRKVSGEYTFHIHGIKYTSRHLKGIKACLPLTARGIQHCNIVEVAYQQLHLFASSTRP